ncbi:MAG: NADH-quinone oxidoreductase subunit F [Coriobacteriia bacterium]|nr:MAG: NADH-quinone oxidoreductase subunit F [Coriobacteriia bacterium]
MNSEALESLRRCGKAQLGTYPRITVGLGTCGNAAGAQKVYDAFQETLAGAIAEGRVRLDGVGCRGACWAEPLVEVQMGDGRSYVFANVTEGRAPIIAKQVLAGKLNARRCIGYYQCGADSEDVSSPLLAQVEDLASGQSRYLMGPCGYLDPLSLEQYAAIGGLRALQATLSKGGAEEVLLKLGEAGLRGRGGAGFPTAQKWRAAADSDDPVRYVIVNGDEGDPGAYMDRTLMESAPYQVLEGALLAAVGIGAHEVIVFVRSEYKQACTTLERAVQVLRENGVIGPNALGSGYGLDVFVEKSAGSFVCGEETALIAAFEGRIPRPSKKPPYPAERGLFGHPTVIDNVETLANAPLIVAGGVGSFRSHGTVLCPGTKTICLTGAVNRTGVVEVDMGTPLSHVVCELGGVDEASVKAVQLGGPSGAFIAQGELGMPLDFESIAQEGTIMGSGGALVIGQGDCVVDLTRYLMEFCAEESCGRCKPCAGGTRECARILERLCDGQGHPEDLDGLEDLGNAMMRGSLCGLGKSASGPLLSAIAQFRPEFEAHIEGTCPSAVCRSLVQLVIVPEKCQGERCCLGTCPGNAVKGKFGKPGTIDPRLCEKCFTCIDACPYDAIKVLPS